MKVAIRVHTPKLSKACQEIAIGFKWKWGSGGVQHIDKSILWFTEDCRGKYITWSGEPWSATPKSNPHTILDAKTDMDKIVEFFKTGKIKEKEMGKIIEFDTSGSVSLKFDDKDKTCPLGVKIKGDSFRWLLHSEACKMRDALLEHFPLEDAKPEKRILVEREIAMVSFTYDDERKPERVGRMSVGTDHGFVFSDSELDQIQEWLDEIKAAKKSN